LHSAIRRPLGQLPRFLVLWLAPDDQRRLGARESLVGGRLFVYGRACRRRSASDTLTRSTDDGSTVESAERGARRDRRSKKRREERKLFCGFSELQVQVVASADLMETLTRCELVQ
jgi:hypothetical protein